LGNKCSRCGYDKYIGALDFHHLDPKDKKFPISKAPVTITESLVGTTSSDEKINLVISELDKCEVLCKNCHHQEHNLWRFGHSCDPSHSFGVKRKIDCFNSMGGQCQVCDNNKLHQLTFHHLDPQEKEFTTSSLFFRRKKNLIIKEMLKCIILCANCHAEVENNIHKSLIKSFQKEERKELEKKLDLILKDSPKKKMFHCKFCQSKISQGLQICAKCSSFNQRKVKRPPYKQLIEELRSSSYVALGKKYGVSDNAIRKWVKCYEKELNL
jgi:hypothetical protein